MQTSDLRKRPKPNRGSKIQRVNSYEQPDEPTFKSKPKRSKRVMKSAQGLNTRKSFKSTLAKSQTRLRASKSRKPKKAKKPKKGISHTNHQKN